jgi:hypothetical protein
LLHSSAQRAYVCFCEAVGELARIQVPGYLRDLPGEEQDRSVGAFWFKQEFHCGFIHCGTQRGYRSGSVRGDGEDMGALADDTWTALGRPSSGSALT